jgi:hypothetical protein
VLSDRFTPVESLGGQAHAHVAVAEITWRAANLTASAHHTSTQLTSLSAPENTARLHDASERIRAKTPGSANWFFIR